MSTVLVTGFGPFGAEADNPSGRVASMLDGRRVDGHDVVGRVLPVATARAAAELEEAVGAVEPALVVVTGVAPGRTAPALERVALNVRDFPIPDVDGERPVDEPVVAGGPAAYLATLPIKAVLAAWRAEGLPGYVSNTAGTYLCNEVFYTAMHLSAGGRARCGLVHLPVLPGRAAGGGNPPPPSLPIDLLERAVEVCIEVAATHSGPDAELPAGALS